MGDSQYRTPKTVEAGSEFLYMGCVEIVSSSLPDT